VLEAAQMPEHVDVGVSFMTIRAEAAFAVIVLVVFRDVFTAHLKRKFLLAYLEDHSPYFDFGQGTENHGCFSLSSGFFSEGSATLRSTPLAPKVGEWGFRLRCCALALCSCGPALAPCSPAVR